MSFFLWNGGGLARRARGPVRYSSGSPTLRPHALARAPWARGGKLASRRIPDVSHQPHGISSLCDRVSFNPGDLHHRWGYPPADTPTSWVATEGQRTTRRPGVNVRSQQILGGGTDPASLLVFSDPGWVGDARRGRFPASQGAKSDGFLTKAGRVARFPSVWGRTSMSFSKAGRVPPPPVRGRTKRISSRAGRMQPERSMPRPLEAHRG